MRKLTFFAAALLVAASSAATATAAAPSQAAQTCTALRTGMTPAAFTATYATFGTCVSLEGRTVASTKKSAAAACRAERDDADFAAEHGGRSFAKYYAGPGGPLAKCRARQASSMLATLAQHRARAAKACWAQRQADPEMFQQRWKSFAACVAGDARIT